MKPARMVAIVLTLLLVVYPLSIGPVVIFLSRVHLKEQTNHAVDTFYAPIIWSYTNNQMVRNAYDWYFNLLGA